MDRIPIIAIVGPTASGKTNLGVCLAKQYNGEIISADSKQFYRGFDIVTAKPTQEQQRIVKHHLIDFLDIHDSFSVADYIKIANKTIDDICARGKQPFIVGGSGQYIDALLEGLTFTEQKMDPEKRTALAEQAHKVGNEAMLWRLKKIDPDYAAKLHPNNIKRIIRALELYESTGMTMTEQIKKSREIPSRFIPCYIGINYRNRAQLYQRIEERIDIMLQKGLLAELQTFYYGDNLDTFLYQSIGIKEFHAFFQGKKDLQSTIAYVKQQTRRYAKRQLTWLHRNKMIHWIYPDEENLLTICEQSALIIEKFQKL